MFTIRLHIECTDGRPSGPTPPPAGRASYTHQPAETARGRMGPTEQQLLVFTGPFTKQGYRHQPQGTQGFFA